MDGWMDGQMDGWIDGWMDEWMGDRMIERSERARAHRERILTPCSHGDGGGVRAISGPAVCAECRRSILLLRNLASNERNELSG